MNVREPVLHFWMFLEMQGLGSSRGYLLNSMQLPLGNPLLQHHHQGYIHSVLFQQPGSPSVTTGIDVTSC